MVSRKYKVAGKQQVELILCNIWLIDPAEDDIDMTQVFF